MEVINKQMSTPTVAWSDLDVGQPFIFANDQFVVHMKIEYKEGGLTVKLSGPNAGESFMSGLGCRCILVNYKLVEV